MVNVGGFRTNIVGRAGKNLSNDKNNVFYTNFERGIFSYVISLPLKSYFVSLKLILNTHVSQYNTRICTYKTVLFKKGMEFVHHSTKGGLSKLKGERSMELLEFYLQN